MTTKQQKHIAVYTRNGKLINTYTKVSSIARDYEFTTSAGIHNAINSGKLYKDMFFKEFIDDEEIPETITVPYLCKIDDIYFIRQIEIVNYLGVTRQVVSAAVKAHAKKIAGRKIEWLDKI